jgi:HKD family nuclease
MCSVECAVTPGPPKIMSGRAAVGSDVLLISIQGCTWCLDLMATPEFILQGFTASTHIDALRRLFDLADIQRVLVSVAFATAGGVEKIEAKLAPHAACAIVFVGIRNDTTSYQGLVRLHTIVSQLYLVDTGSRAIIFHPKLYLVRGVERARLMIGSANLTVAGLNNNIEAGMLLDFDLADTADKAVVEEIERLFLASVTDYPGHIGKVEAAADLDNLLAADRLIDERNNPLAQDGAASNGATNIDELVDREIDNDERAGIPQIRLKVKPLPSGMPKSRQEIAEEASTGATVQIEPEEEISPAGNAELEPTNIPTWDPVVKYSRKKKYISREEGPRLKAGRLRMEAKRLGKKWYFTGEPCIYGHISDRLVTNGKCRECNRQDCERYNRLRY